MKVVRKTLEPGVVEFERRAFFNASLKLISAGKFQLASMDEIAFHARISGMATPFIFENKNNLFSDLVEDITSQIAKVMNDEMTKAHPLKQKFFALWLALYEYYSKHPGVASFIEQREALCKSSSSEIYPDAFEPLIGFFKSAKDEIRNDISAEILATVFHENILAAVKLRSGFMSDAENLRLKLLPLLLWENYVCHERGGQKATYR
ncbi:MAG TPA: hypothetical protein VFW11_19315 [Cyclobacteriaceae bacterium]|nr:hypothetical protein [Cyclobacteriaceae bacterium]